ncbi:uncharacterized protein RCO7_01155 [Rhynchosporium graminicola]|uniref:DUF3328 domain protein n=1 Tax=Rhynchosporium graminicola TaxID=2792576 RepID=A0A1E1JRB9_9HELO|nr:uncharacterized protein RCO7_01155 [Rhynchosporium commune]
MEPVTAETPFLEDNKHSPDSSIDGYLRTKPEKRSWIRRNIKAISIHLILVITYTTTVAATLNLYFKPNFRRSPVYSPANVGAHYKSIKISDSPADVGKSLYVGEPSSGKDAEWYKLLHYHNIRLTAEDLQELNATSIPLGSGGYQGMLAVMHELHCLKLVREALHPEYYWKEKSEKEIRSMKGHNEHCIDALRMAVMCRADVTVFPFHWKSGTRLPSPTWSQNHECVNWDVLQKWMDTRVVDVKAPGVLTHPKWGPSYPNGQRIEEPNGPVVIPPG